MMNDSDMGAWIAFGLHVLLLAFLGGMISEGEAGFLVWGVFIFLVLLIPAGLYRLIKGASDDQ